MDQAPVILAVESDQRWVELYSYGSFIIRTISASRRNFVQVAGNGDRAIIFAHGYGCDQNMWRYVTHAFSDQYRIVLFDHVGCGKSDPAAFSESRYTWLRGYARDALEIIEEQALEKVTFAGHSVSSMIGALAAIERPELFENLVMIGPSPCYINDGECRRL
jgi:sigma-B regulation protein RsbQ